VPLLQSSPFGLDFKIFSLEKYTDYNYRMGMFYFTFFHFNLILTLICLFKVSFKDPGKLSDEFKEIFTLIPNRTENFK
jgi:hypothetical protein